MSLSDPRTAQIHRTRRLVRSYIDGLRDVEAALTDDDLGTLVHGYQSGKSTPAENFGSVLARNLQTAAAEIGIQLAILDGLAQQSKHDAQESDLAERRTRAAPRYEIDPPGGRPLPLVPPVDLTPADALAEASRAHARRRDR